MTRPGVIVSLTANALQFLAGADEIEDTYGQLLIKRSGSIVGVYRSGQWMHAARIADWPLGLSQDPQTSIWIIDTPEVTDGVPDAHPLPERGSVRGDDGREIQEAPDEPGWYMRGADLPGEAPAE